ncbi:MAG: transketolase [Ardenticatenaceae bacterium]|nr:transketolase [Ardenticatenaceae bacterium]
MTSRENPYVNTLRFLAVDAVQQADSGHPGLPLGSATMMYTLWTYFLRFNPHDPQWPNRDRFVLSAGHGCALLYAMLHLTGYDLPLDELKRFRQWGSRTPGHPEYGLTPGVEATTGPLGQGFANAVGMAIAEAALAARFNKLEYPIVDHYTYALASDGDLMEGISSEAASLAGHLKLGKLVVLYANNHISIEGSTDLAFSEDPVARFASYGWQVQQIEDGNDLAALDEAIGKARDERERPSFISVRTHIGYGSPHKQDTAAAHGEPLGEEEVRLTKKNLGWPPEPAFLIPKEALAHYREAVDRGAKWQAEWEALFAAYSADFPELAVEFHRVMQGELPDNWAADLPRFLPDGQPIATRSASGKVINALAACLPELMGGAADLAPSTRTLIENGGDFAVENRNGRNLHFGIREHAMGAVLNGMALHGGLIPYGATFLIFSDYMRPPMRLAAMNKLPVIYVFTHDSIALGEDGPTHQPVEQLLGLRSIPDMTVIRPADANETAAAWEAALEHRDGPVALILTRQKLPVLDPQIHGDITLGVRHGGYILAREPEDNTPDIILVATGSEVHLALPAQAHLATRGIHARVVSMPSWELFQRQPALYRNHVLLPHVPLLGIEAGRTLGWQTYNGSGIPTIGVDRFGTSAPGLDVTAHYRLTIAHVQEQAESLLNMPTNLGSNLLVAMDDSPLSLDTIRDMVAALPDPAHTDVTLMHYLSPVYWEYGGGDPVAASIMEDTAWQLERKEEQLTEKYFAKAKAILAEAGIGTTHVRTVEDWEAADVADAILQEVKQGVFTAVVIGQHHHHTLAELLGRDLASILRKHTPYTAVWSIENEMQNAPTKELA